MADKLLEFSHVSKEFRIGGMLRGKKIQAVDDVSFSLPSDHPVILSIVGESGCGKSTLCKMLLKIHAPSAGTITLDGMDVTDKRYKNDKFYDDVQPIFQNPFEAFSMRKKVDTYLISTANHIYGGDRIKVLEKVDEALHSVGLSYALIEGKYPAQFSGGELQRVSIARALITHPKVIVADEPVAMVDASMKMNIVNLFRSLKTQYNVSFIYITHDLSTAYYVSDTIATLYRGEIIEYGAAKDIMENPAHPYTRLLMDSIPRVGARWNSRIAMPDMEDKEYAATCCKFAARCQYATDECRRTRPIMSECSNGRMVKCYHALI